VLQKTAGGNMVKRYRRRGHVIVGGLRGVPSEGQSNWEVV
jgi:hypothetical protein